MAIGDIINDTGKAIGGAIGAINPWAGAGIGLLGLGGGALANRYWGGQSSPSQDVKSLASGAGNALSGFFGQPGGFMQAPRYSPAQMQFLENQILPLLQQQLGQQGQNQLSFGPIKQEAQRRFQQETAPSIAERFSSLGGIHNRNALSSGTLQSQLYGAGAQLDSQLAAMEQQFGQQNAGLNQNLLNMLLTAGLQPQFETAYNPGVPGFSSYAGEAAGRLAPEGIKAILSYLSQPKQVAQS